MDKTADRAWIAVGVLFLAYILSFVDRMMLSLLVEPIKADLHLTDVQIGLLTGIAFAFFYTVAGIPIAAMADRYNRRRIIAVGMTAWSLMTALCGLARSFPALFAARVGVGVGEATLSPSTYSLLADLFPRHRMGWAISLFNCGVYLGSGGAMLLGGMVLAAVSAGGTVTLPLLGELKAWQFAFVFVGALGLPFVPLLLLFPEPKRTAAPKEAATFAALFAHIGAHRTFVGCFFGGMIVISLAGYNFLHWSPTVFVRVHKWPVHEVGLIIGSIVLVVGTVANLIGARIAEALDRRGVKDSIMIIMSVGAAGVALAGTLVSNANPHVALAGFGTVIFFSGLPLGIAHAALQLTSPSRARAKITAVFTFFNNMLGLGAGPVLVAVLTQYFFADPLAIGQSLSAVGFVAAGLASVLFFIARKPYIRALESQAGPGPAGDVAAAPARERMA